MIFDAPLLLFLAPAVALAVGFAAWLGRGRRHPAGPALVARAGEAGQAPGAGGPRRCSAWWRCSPWWDWPGPRLGRTEITTETRALSLVFAVDISRSMLAEDVAPNRLQRAVREARRLIEDLGGDRLGLIAFAGQSYILAPLTVDGGAIRMYLDALDPDLASSGGSNLARGARAGHPAPQRHDRRRRPGAGAVHRRRGARHSAGDRGAGRSAQGRRRAADRRRRRAARCPTRIPIRDSAGTITEYKQDAEGDVVQTRRRDDVLRAMVEAAEGTLVPSEVPDQAGAVRDLVSAMKRSPSSRDPHRRSGAPRRGSRCSRRRCCSSSTPSRGRGPRWSASPACSSAQARRRRSAPPPGERALAAGDPAGAAAAFLAEASRGTARDTAFYNAGTAALEAGRLDVARGALAEAAKSLDPALRYRALYNLGLVGLLAAEAGHHDGRTSSWTTRWIACARRCCCEPSSARAKWNLELADRRRPPPPSGGGGGGGGTPPPPSGGGQREQQPQGETPRPGSLPEPGGADPQFDGAARARDPGRAAAPASGRCRPAE